MNLSERVTWFASFIGVVATTAVGCGRSGVGGS